MLTLMQYVVYAVAAFTLCAALVWGTVHMALAVAWKLDRWAHRRRMRRAA